MFRAGFDAEIWENFDINNNQFVKITVFFLTHSFLQTIKAVSDDFLLNKTVSYLWTVPDDSVSWPQHLRQLIAVLIALFIIYWFV